jgi:predicted nuclease of predicted toxin-antitoxin system
MKLHEFPLLTDENVDRDVVAWLRQTGFDVLDVSEQRLFGEADSKLLQLAVASGRIVMTHDADFGTLAVLNGEPVVGLVYLRPGHFDPAFTIETIRAILAVDPDLFPPFILVAKRSGSGVTIRIRQLS